jgi:uncharacterized protein YjbJ (UPF0337 family)
MNRSGRSLVMAAGDKARNKVEELKGKVKKKVGEVTGTEQVEAEGKGEEAKADINQAVEKVKDAFTGDKNKGSR